MPLEIDMLAVGDANAIVIRTTQGYSEQVVVVDGGNSSDGKAVIDHIDAWTTRRNCIDLLISTHPDADHIDGLHALVGKLDINNVWIHDPSIHHRNVKALIRELRTSSSSIIQEAAKSLDSSTILIALMDALNIPRAEPFAGKKYTLLDGGVLTVLGPTEDYYEELLADMKQSAEKAIREEFIMEKFREIRGTKSIVTARQLLDETNDPSPSNNSSVIFALTYGSSTYLFTADAGPSALCNAREMYPHLMSNVKWLQVPHHGSRKSLTCDLVDYIHPNTAYISAAGTTEYRPDRAVVEVLKEIGCQVYSTSKTGSIYHSYPYVPRDGYVHAQELELSDLV